MVQTVNGKRMTSPGVILETESQYLESPLLGNGYGGFGEGREETCLESNAPCAYSTVYFSAVGRRCGESSPARCGRRWTARWAPPPDNRPVGGGFSAPA